MKISAISTALALLASLSQAAPTEDLEARQTSVLVKFIGAGGASYTQTFRRDGVSEAISQFGFFYLLACLFS